MAEALAKVAAEAKCPLALSGASLDELADLTAAVNALGEITGAVTSDDLLGRIFSEFCIGK